MTRRLLPEALFGAVDGTAAAIGIAAGTGRPHLGLVFCVALAGLLSMAAGEWLSNPATSVPAATVLGAATFAGTFGPALPAVLWPGPAGLAVTLAAGLAVALCAGAVRARTVRSLATSAAVFAAVAVPTALAGWAVSGTA